MDPALKELMEQSGGPEIEAVIRLAPGQEPPPGVRLVARFGEIATCRLLRHEIEEVWSDEAVVSLKAPRPFGADPDPLREADDDPDSPGGEPGPEPGDRRRPEGLDVTGHGILVCGVDWGLDFAHPNFRRANGSTRVVALWDQSAPGPGVPPYGYGRVHTREEIDRALRSDTPYAALGYHPGTGDRAGRGAHGTHVCDIAAGNGRAEGAPEGMAPEAEILFVHLANRGTGGHANLGDSVTLLEALDWIRREAGDRPWVVNLSVGLHGGPHTGETLVEKGIDALLAEAPGRCAVQSGGNYFDAHVHASGTLRPGKSCTLRWWTDRSDLTPNELEVWYSGRDRFSVEVLPPDGGEPVRVPLGGRAVLVADGREVGRAYHRAQDPAHGDHHIDIFLDPVAPPGLWQVELAAEEVVDGRWHAWVERDSGCPTCQSRLDPEDADPATTTGTICNGFRSIAVGAYDAHDPERPLARFSSSGPTRDGRVKPDLVAPGVRVLAARSASFAEGSDTPLLTRFSGTSMAAPHVTGTVALLFEAAGRPLSIHETRRLLLGTAEPLLFPPEQAVRAGSGYLDTARAVEAARGLAAPREVAEAAEAEMEVEMEVEAPCACAAAESVETGAGDEGTAACGCRHAVESAPEDSALDGEVEHEAEQIPELQEAFRTDGISGEPIAGDRGETTMTRDEETETPEAAEDDLLARALNEISAAGPAAGLPAGTLAPATLFDLFLPSAPPVLRGPLESRFAVVARPGERLAESLQAGDLLVRRALGEGGVGHLAMVTSAERWSHGELAARGFAVEAPRAGWYAQVTEAGAFSGRAPVSARWIAGPGDRLSRDQMVLRPRPWPAGAEMDEAAPDRTAPAYVRWIQESLGRILGAPLAVNGILDAPTVRAVRAFQQRQGGLAVDGIVGPKTEGALIAAGAGQPPGAAQAGFSPDFPAPPVPVPPIPGPRGPVVVLDRFGRDQAVLTAEHRARLEHLADQIAASQATAGPVEGAAILGHTDESGGRAYNLDLGRRRAEAVRGGLEGAVERRAPGLWARLRVHLETAGEERPAASNATADGQARNRRVDVVLLVGGGLDPGRFDPIRPVQACLGRLLGKAVPVTGVFDPGTRGAVQAFQQRRGIAPATGSLTLPTAAALRTLCALKPPVVARQPHCIALTGFASVPVTLDEIAGGARTLTVASTIADLKTLRRRNPAGVQVPLTHVQPSGAPRTFFLFDRPLGEIVLDTGYFRVDPKDAARYQIPLNARICYPADPKDPDRLQEGKERFPVVVIVHGQHEAVVFGATPTSPPRVQGLFTVIDAEPNGVSREVPNHAGYDELQQELVRKGFVAVSIETNPANLFDSRTRMRAETILANLDRLRDLDKDPKSRFFQRLNLGRVGLMGHSRGGDAVVEAEVLNRARKKGEGFGIVSVVSLAPTDFTGVLPAAQRLRVAPAIDYFVLYGSHDGDVAGVDGGRGGVGTGFRHYDRAPSARRAMVFLHGGTHNRFNTEWGNVDPLHDATDQADSRLIDAPNHRRLANEYIGGWFRLTLLGEKALEGLFDGSQANGVGAPVSVQWHFGKAVKAIDPFDDARRDLNKLTGAVKAPAFTTEVEIVSENPARYPHQDQVLKADVTATSTGSYRSEIPDAHRDFNLFSHLILRLAKEFDATSAATVAATRLPRFKVRLLDGRGKSAVLDQAAIFGLNPRRPTRPYFREFRQGGATSNITLNPLETLSIPLASFTGIDRSDIEALELEFDPAQPEKIFVDTLTLVRR